MIISRPGFSPIDDGKDKPKAAKPAASAVLAALAAQKAAAAAKGPAPQVIANPAPLPLVNGEAPAPAVEHGPVPHAVNVPHAV